LLNLKTTPEALPILQSTAVKQLFRKYKVLSTRELESRYDIYLEHYCKSVNVETKLTIEMSPR
jgi:glutamine synthetase